MSEDPPVFRLWPTTAASRCDRGKSARRNFISRVIGVRRHSLNTGAAMARSALSRCALEVAMKCLWLTLADPEPATNGQLIYSKGLIEAACRAGASLAVIGLARSDNPRPSAEARTIDWRLADEGRKSAGRRLLAPIPPRRSVATADAVPSRARPCAKAMGRRRVRQHLCRMGPAHVLRHRVRSAQPPRLVYVAHNHEVTVARSIATAAQGLRRIAKEIDCLKVIGLERRLISAADTVTSNTPDDCRRFAADSNGRPIAFLPPGYGGPRVAFRTIDASVPRRAILVGSLDWPPKRVSLESFLEAAADRMASAGIELQIVGEVEAGYVADLRRRFPTVDFVGRVADVRPYMQPRGSRWCRTFWVVSSSRGSITCSIDCRYWRCGGLARHAVGGTAPASCYSTVTGRWPWRCRADRRLPLPQRAAGLAYVACADRFDWDRIGRHLVAHLRGTTDRRVRAGTGGRTADAVSPPARLAAGR